MKTMTQNIMTVAALANVKRCEEEDMIIEKFQFSTKPPKERLQIILDAVCSTFDIKPEAILKNKRLTSNSHIRYIFYYVAAMRSSCAYTAIGAKIGSSSHTAVSKAIGEVRDKLENPRLDPSFIKYWQKFKVSVPHYLIPNY